MSICWITRGKLRQKVALQPLGLPGCCVGAGPNSGICPDKRESELVPSGASLSHAFFETLHDLRTLVSKRLSCPAPPITISSVAIRFCLRFGCSWSSGRKPMASIFASRIMSASDFCLKLGWQTVSQSAGSRTRKRTSVHLVATRWASVFWDFFSPLVSFRTRLAFSVSSIFFNRLLEVVCQSSLVGEVNW